MTENTAYRAALRYAQRGWSVIPVRPREKVPAVAWAEYQTRPAGAALFESWWLNGHPDRGVGVVTGAISGLLVLDFDGEQGMETLAALEAEHGDLPPTVRQLTPSGGCHVLFRHPGGTIPNRAGIRPGMDVRGDGGYIVTEPSIHPSGREYAWDVDAHPEEVEIAECPAWVVELVRAPIVGASIAGTGHPGDEPALLLGFGGAGSLGILPAPLTDGREHYMRDMVWAALASHQAHGEMPDPEELAREVWEVYSAKVDFTRPGRGWEEMLRKCRYAVARAKAGRGPGEISSPRPQPLIIPKIDLIIPSGEISQTAFTTFAEAAINTDTHDFVEATLVDNSMACVYGQSNSGKTFLMGDLGMRVAGMAEWRTGLSVETGLAIHLAMEGGFGISNRIAAFKIAHGLQNRDIPFVFTKMSWNFLDMSAHPAGLRALLDAIKAAQDRFSMPARLITVDTLARALTGGDENSAKDMGLLIGAADVIRRETTACLAWVHHSGKDEARGARGHSSLRAAVETEIEVTDEGDGLHCATVSKQRDMEGGQRHWFRLETVVLGANRRGKPITSCVVREADAPEEKTTYGVVEGDTKAAFDALNNAITEHGSLDFGGHPDRPSIPEKWWKDRFYATAKPGAKDAAKERAFNRAAQKLRDMGWIGMDDGRVWNARAGGV